MPIVWFLKIIVCFLAGISVDLQTFLFFDLNLIYCLYCSFLCFSLFFVVFFGISFPGFTAVKGRLNINCKF